VNKEVANDLSLFVGNDEVLVLKLTEVVIVYNERDHNNFPLLVNNCQNTLKSLHVITDQNSVNLLMQPIKCLKFLRELRLDFCNSVEIVPLLIKEFRAISIQCNQITTFGLSLSCNDPTLVNQMLKTMSYFKTLKCINFEIYYGELEEELEQDNYEVVSESLKNCKNLTHLELYYGIINDSFYENIDLYLPKLKILKIEANCITDKALYSLANLKELKLIYISAYEINFVTDTEICHIINNCHKINSIIFYSQINITHKTVEELIKLALSKPKIQFKHHFSSIGCRNWLTPNALFEMITIDLEEFGVLPKNLVFY